MRKRVAITLLLCILALLAVPALAAQPLDADTLTAWRDALEATLAGLPVRNDPSLTHDPQAGDAWLYAYDFGLVTQTANAGDDPAIAEVELLQSGMPDPRGIQVGDTLGAVLGAYPNENPALTGNARYATLYVQGSGDVRGWGWLMRRNQLVDGVEYAVCVPAQGMDGFSQVLSVFYVIEEERVSAIRVGGFASLISDDEIAASLASVREIAQQDAYDPATITSADVLTAPDLTFGGVDFATGTVEDLMAAIGAPFSDETDEGVRVLNYIDFLVECTQRDGQWQPDAALVLGGLVEGPRHIRIGDSMASVQARLGPGEADGDALTYASMGTDGQSYVLRCTFHEGILTEYLLYRV